MNKLQKLAFSQPWADDRKRLKPACEILAGGLAVGLSLNY